MGQRRDSYLQVVTLMRRVYLTGGLPCGRPGRRRVAGKAAGRVDGTAAGRVGRCVTGWSSAARRFLNARNFFVARWNNAYDTSLESSFEDLSNDMQYAIVL